MKQLISKNVYFIGDTHNLNYDDILRHYNLKDFVIIHVGDSGEGFNHQSRDQRAIQNLQNYCEQNNGQILTVRGNHTNPTFYNDPDHWTTKYDRVHFVPDYTYYDINGKICLFVGGATSIDRVQRVQGMDYWKDEVFVLSENYTNLDQCDVLITHSAPISCPPIDGFSRIAGWFKNDPTLKSELIKEREDVEKLYQHVNCSQLYYGHFHHSSSYYNDGCYHRCLDINEIVDATREFSDEKSNLWQHHSEINPIDSSVMAEL